jgi:hypothetical protein
MWNNLTDQTSDATKNINSISSSGWFHPGLTNIHPHGVNTKQQNQHQPSIINHPESLKLLIEKY